MNNVWSGIVKTVSAAVGGVVGLLLGGWSLMITWLLIFNIVDYATGVIVAACGKSTKTESGKLSSKVGLIGIARKGLIWLVVIIASGLDRIIGTDGETFRMAAVCFYLANEGLSILENISLMGVPLPEFLKRMLESLSSKSNEAENITPENVETVQASTKFAQTGKYIARAVEDDDEKIIVAPAEDVPDKPPENGNL